MYLARTSIAGLACAAAIAIAAPALAGVVVKSSGPSAAKYPTGKKLGDNDRITLKEGDSVTILGAGGTRVLKGAGTYRVGARGAPTRLRFAQLTRQRSARRVRTGAVRSGTGIAVHSPNLWYVDVTRSGPVCVEDLSDVTLWRPISEGQQTYIIKAQGNDFHLHVTFGDGVMSRPVDSERFPIREGIDYRLSGPEGEGAAKVTFALIDGAGDNPEDLAGKLIAKGCNAQLELLSNTMMADAQGGQ